MEITLLLLLLLLSMIIVIIIMNIIMIIIMISRDTRLGDLPSVLVAHVLRG